MKKVPQKCEKCGKKTYLDTHHILPKSVFGENKETVELCPTCHREYHEHLGRENLKNPSMEFHLYIFAKWLTGITFGLLLIGFLLWEIWKK